MSFPMPRRRGVGGVLARRDTSISSLSLHRDRDDYIPTTHLRGIARAEEWTSACLPELYPPPESLRTIHPPARRRRPDATHTHVRTRCRLSAHAGRLTPSPRGSVLDVALRPPRSLFGSLPLRKSALREHAPLTILELPLLLAPLLVALRVDDPLVF